MSSPCSISTERLVKANVWAKQQSRIRNAQMATMFDRVFEVRDMISRERGSHKAHVTAAEMAPHIEFCSRMNPGESATAIMRNCESIHHFLTQTM